MTINHATIIIAIIIAVMSLYRVCGEQNGFFAQAGPLEMFVSKAVRSIFSTIYKNMMIMIIIIVNAR